MNLTNLKNQKIILKESFFVKEIFEVRFGIPFHEVVEQFDDSSKLMKKGDVFLVEEVLKTINYNKSTSQTTIEDDCLILSNEKFDKITVRVDEKFFEIV